MFGSSLGDLALRRLVSPRLQLLSPSRSGDVASAATAFFAPPLSLSRLERGHKTSSSVDSQSRSTAYRLMAEKGILVKAQKELAAQSSLKDTLG